MEIVEDNLRGTLFGPAHSLYRKYGFDFCEPFGDYQLDPYSCFMTRAILENEKS